MRKRRLFLAQIEILETRRLLANLQGLDAAGYQYDLNWTDIKADGYAFAYEKATQGNYYTNPYYSYNITQAKAAGVAIGSYDFADSLTVNPTTEANFFWNEIKSTISGDGKSLQPMLDAEKYQTGNEDSWIATWSSVIVADGKAAGYNLSSDRLHLPIVGEILFICHNRHEFSSLVCLAGFDTAYQCERKSLDCLRSLAIRWKLSQYPHHRWRRKRGCRCRPVEWRLDRIAKSHRRYEQISQWLDRRDQHQRPCFAKLQWQRHLMPAVPTSTKGTVLSGPQYYNNAWYFDVSFTDGISGWVNETSMIAVAGPPAAPTNSSPASGTTFYSAARSDLEHRFHCRHLQRVSQ